MSKVTQWQELLPTLRDRYIGGDIEEHSHPEGIFRGPISDIKIEGDTLTISSPWCAHFEGEGWVKWHITSGGYSLEYCTAPQDIGNDRLMFSSTPFSRIVLFPKDGSKLDPKKVRNL